GLYALGSPGRAALSRAITVILTLVFFVGLSLTIGESGPGWAMVCGTAAGLVITSFIALSRAQSAREAAGQASRKVDTKAETKAGSSEPPDKSG
ncbi:MAG: hypothetical protein VXW22_11805, partial [Pseudomonadota bacterium]|nr:hypothetical protein [Pseudomonadota bacterium]